MQDQLGKLVGGNEFLQVYMEYVKKTESPRIMHVWSSLGAAAACMGRHTCLASGIGPLYANMFILLVGPPGTRKSSAITYAAKLVKENTAIRFAPDDTGGQRQGLITALEGDVHDELEEGTFKKGGKKVDDALHVVEAALRVGATTSLDQLRVLESLEIRMVHPEDKHTMFAAASEFGTFMGEANSNTTRFLNKVWDGEDYDYKLRTQQQRLREPLMTLIGGTTSSDLARILPDQAIGQGFMSRMILVFAPNKEKKVPEPELNLNAGKVIGQLFEFLAHAMRGEMKQEPMARERLNDMYEHEIVDMQDTRFIYYQERRHTHLKKLAMVFAACRRSVNVSIADIESANMLLTLTEAKMPEALGEFGMSPIGAAKQKLVEFLQASHTPVPQSVLQTLMSRDMTKKDFQLAMVDLVNAKKIAPITNTLGTCFVYIEDIASVFAEMANA